MPKKYPCSILESGRIKNFDNAKSLAGYLKVHPETIIRWRKQSIKDKIYVKYYESILIDFSPQKINNKS